jgi:iron complex outermembrane recepter protein
VLNPSPVADRRSTRSGAALPLLDEKRLHGRWWNPPLAIVKTVRTRKAVGLKPAANRGRRMITSQFSNSDTIVARILAPFASQGVTTAQFFTNAVDTKTRGLDVVLAYASDFAGGTLNLTASANFTHTDVERVNVPQSMADTFASGNLAAIRGRILNPEDRNRLEDGLPRRKGSLSARWHRGRFGALARATHYGPITYHHPSDTLNEQFSAKALVDLDLSYEVVGGVRLAVGGNNVFNTYPDEQQRAVNRDNGRFVYSRRVTQFGMNGGFYYARLALSL